MSLADKKCIPCKGGMEPLKGEQLRAYHEHVQAWEVVNEHHLARTWKFHNFAEALGFVNRVAELAEQEGHHPWIHFTWGIVRIELWTHKIDGLHESDFILAAKIDRL
jgi:4a-hydroxytetrahydrobiopterin dehydratase